MSQRLVAVVGRNNTQAEVTGQNELLVKVGSIGSTTGLATEATLNSLNNKFVSLVRTPNIIRATGSGTIASIIYDFSIANVGAADGIILGATIKPGETLSFSAGTLNNYYTAGTITYDGTGTELVIIYNS